MIGMIRFTPEESVRWYLPSRSMIIVCACCTTRTPLATIEIATSAITAGTISAPMRSEEHTSELQSHSDLVCRLLLEKKKQWLRRAGRGDAPRRHLRDAIE